MYRLTQKIIALSTAKTWDKARLEWKLDDVYYEDDPDTCLCGHFPIIEICGLLNKQNGRTATVGNCCVKKFIGLPSDKIFQAVRRVRHDNTKALNEETISHAYKHGWITDWERNFYSDTMRKRNMSEKQRTTRIQLKKKVLSKIIAARPKTD
ncbi:MULTISPECIES: hypothetical protein [unclassified Coleofasciculus]|uniref:hypothetical protein n=1 Tax=unclassified Coleofasciculus TaxID=2692782 RepID=UPI001880165E|nr:MULTISPECIES: hypothetical protein [unclassified Coleofasciculus]MBE9127914.1 hypothetical protein [Coleofasciculus sp. LEGE 07081]MBE9150626.1 hypothetical protein [Coleofasciculus sp. LEGE 07092]